MNQPIDSITWVHVNDLSSNLYNPNVCSGLEHDLLAHSLLTNGWIQPVLAHKETNTIIDGFHRWNLTRTNTELFKMTDGKVPVAFLDISEADRMMLTIRINRAKGVHVAFKMHDLVSSLVKDHELTVNEIAKGIGAPKHEIETLLLEDVFEKKDVKNTAYSRAWRPQRNAS
ncbi:MAG: IbrB [Helicobacteraceae bacterium]|nr:IbrB [Helicobacteraceae bacterium]